MGSKGLTVLVLVLFAPGLSHDIIMAVMKHHQCGGSTVAGAAIRIRPEGEGEIIVVLPYAPERVGKMKKEMGPLSLTPLSRGC